MAAKNTKKLKEEREIEEERSRKEREERRKFERLRSIENDRISELEEKASDHNRAKLIRDFVGELQNKLQSEANSIDKEKIEYYIAWAKAKADWLDPITAVRDPILDSKHEKWLNSIRKLDNESELDLFSIEELTGYW